MSYKKTKLEEQIGFEITKSSAGGGVGATWEIEFNNGNFFFIHCSWRLIKGEQVLITSQDSVDPNGLISITTPILKGEKIENITLHHNCDISINISSEFRLDVFSDMGPGFELYDNPTNWDLCIPSQDKAICIDNNFKVFEEKYY